MGREFRAGARRVAAALAAGVAFATAAADARPDLADLTLEQLGNLVVTSASRREERLADAATSIYVISAQEIRSSGATTLPQALQLAPNLNVARADTAQYAISARGFNNLLANKMLVLIDGRALYTPLFSGVFWEAQDVALEEVDRIEVISGPGATLWGANAVNGVINVITRSARDTPGPRGVAGHGNRETSGSVRYGGALGAGHYRVYALSRQRENSRLAAGGVNPDAARISQMGFRTDWSGEDHSLSVHGDAYQGSVDPVGPAREFSGANIVAQWNCYLATGGHVRAQVYYDQTRRRHPDLFRERLDTLDVEFQHGFKPAARHDLLWGGGLRHSRDDLENSAALAFVPPDRNLRWANLFVQDQITLRPNLDLTLGGKVERNSYTGNELLPSARLAWRIGDERLAWGALSRAVRAPSRIDRDVFLPADPPFVLAGNSAFRSEVSNVIELGYRARPSEIHSYSITAFHHDHDRLRSVRPGLQGPVFANDIEGKTTGVEAWARWQATHAVALNGGFVRMRHRLNVKPGAVDLGGLAVLGNDPDSWAKVRATWTITPRHELDLSLRRFGSLPNPAVPSYTAVDMHFGWRVSPAVEVSLALRNLFDAEHAEWGAASTRAVFGRAAFLRLTWRP